MVGRAARIEVAAGMSHLLVDSYYGLQYCSFPVHVKLLTEIIITVEVHFSSTIQYLCDQIRQFHAANPLKWPSTCRSSHSSSRLPHSWNAPAALRLCHCDRELENNSTLAQSGVRPGAHLSAHMYFSHRKNLGEINHPETKQCTVKHALAQEDEDQSPLIIKRQKFNEPLRNQHIHRMINLSAELQTNRENAARYGLDEDEMEDLLKELDEVDDDMNE